MADTGNQLVISDDENDTLYSGRAFISPKATQGNARFVNTQDLLSSAKSKGVSSDRNNDVDTLGSAHSGQKHFDSAIKNAFQSPIQEQRNSSGRNSDGETNGM